MTGNYLLKVSANNGCQSLNDTVVVIIKEKEAATVAISASPNPFCRGSEVTCVASQINGGISPAYSWKVNGSNTGSNQASLTLIPAGGDIIQCVMACSPGCIIADTVFSNQIIMETYPAPGVTYQLCFDQPIGTNGRMITLKGGLPPGGRYSVAGNILPNNVLNPQGLTPGQISVSYRYQNVYQCADSMATTIQVLSPNTGSCGNPFIDPRDNQTYPTFLSPDGRCWMGANLNYGMYIPFSQAQSDNCIPEKHCFGDIAGNCDIFGAFYQWNELMNHEDQEGMQDLCPPGWHIASAPEWEGLIGSFHGNGMAGIDLKDQHHQSGFQALLSGFCYQNLTWDHAQIPDIGSTYWTSTQVQSDPARSITRGLHHATPSVSTYPSLRSNSIPARCVRN